MPVIYADVVWIVNLGMDAAILLATCIIVKRKIRPWRLTAGALFGATYALVMFVPHGALFTTWIGKALASLLMVLIVLPYRNLLELARNTAVLYAVTFLMAGAVLAMHFAVPAMTLASGTIVHGGRVAFATSLGGMAIVVGVPISLWLLHMAVGRARRVKNMASSLCEVRAVVGGQAVEFTGLLDTGNQLRDPLSQRPVTLLDADIFKKLMPAAVGVLLEAPGDLMTRLSKIGHLGATAPTLSLVPYRGAGGAETVTVAVKPDRVELRLPDGSVRVAGPCLLAYHARPLSGDGRFQAILHPDMTLGDDRDEEDMGNVESQSKTSHATAATLDTHQG